MILDALLFVHRIAELRPSFGAELLDEGDPGTAGCPLRSDAVNAVSKRLDNHDSVQQEVEASDPFKKEGERTVPFAAADRLFRGPRCSCCNIDCPLRCVGSPSSSHSRSKGDRVVTWQREADAKSSLPVQPGGSSALAGMHTYVSIPMYTHTYN